MAQLQGNIESLSYDAVGWRAVMKAAGCVITGKEYLASTSSLDQ